MIMALREGRCNNRRIHVAEEDEVPIGLSIKIVCDRAVDERRRWRWCEQMGCIGRGRIPVSGNGPRSGIEIWIAARVIVRKLNVHDERAQCIFNNGLPNRICHHCAKEEQAEIHYDQRSDQPRDRCEPRSSFESANGS